jgi:phosphoribosylaminoimidazole-succinocarboxamide synthase
MEPQLIRAMLKSGGKPLSGDVFELHGKSKDLRAATRPGMLLQQFKDECLPDQASASVENQSRAALANEISSFLFEHIHGYRIPTHFVDVEDRTTMLVRRLEMYPLCVRIWNTVGAGFARRLGLRVGSDLPFPVLEHYYRRGDPPYPLVNEFHLFALGVITPEGLRTVNRLASKTNAVLRSLFARRGLKLHSLVLEFGSADGQIMVGDELTPRTCIAGEWQSRLRKEREAFTGGGCVPLEAYQQMRDHLLGLPEGTVQP